MGGNCDRDEDNHKYNYNTELAFSSIPETTDPNIMYPPFHS